MCHCNIFTSANTDAHGIQYKRSENSRKKRRARNKERKQCKKVKFQEEEFIKKKEEEESIKVALQRGKDAESQVNLLKLTVAKLRNENQTLLESRSISSRLSAVPLTVRQDKFRFLASKMPKCNNLSTKVVEFPTKEILLGEGTFCKVVVAKFLTLDIPVAVKIGKAKEFSAKSEGCILQRLAGHRCFPFTFGDFHNMLVMELISELKNGKYMSDTVYSEMERDTLSKKIWIEVLYDLLDAVKFMHFCGILHNDIKCDNILIKKNVHAVYPKLTDFGKATHKLNPITYNLSDADREKYNKKHKHLAIELRNVRGSTQSIMTDIYSLGYVYHIIGTHKELPNLKELSLVMMSEKPDDRPSHTRINKSLKILLEQI